MYCSSIKCYEMFFYMVFIENSAHYVQCSITVSELECLYLLQANIDANKMCKAGENKFGKCVCSKLECTFSYLVVTLVTIFVFLLYK
jgi:hypothetical protein